MELINFTELGIHDLKRDGGTQPREKLDESHIEDLFFSLKNSADFPPVLAYFDGLSYWLADGFHRLAASIRFGLLKIKVEVRQGTLQEAQWHSFSVNQHHALKRSNADKQRAIIGALKHPLGANKSNQQIARHCGIDEKTVRLWRSKLEESGEIEKSVSREVVRGSQVFQRTVGSVVAQPQKFKVVSEDIPEYFGQEVELIQVKGGGCYECKTLDGKVYPFFKSDLASANAVLSAQSLNANTRLKRTNEGVNSKNLSPTNRQKLIAIVLRLPDEVLCEAEKVLIDKYGGILSEEAIGI